MPKIADSRGNPSAAASNPANSPRVNSRRGAAGDALRFRNPSGNRSRCPAAIAALRHCRSAVRSRLHVRTDTFPRPTRPSSRAFTCPATSLCAIPDNARPVPSEASQNCSFSRSESRDSFRFRRCAPLARYAAHHSPHVTRAAAPLSRTFNRPSCRSALGKCSGIKSGAHLARLTNRTRQAVSARKLLIAEDYYAKTGGKAGFEGLTSAARHREKVAAKTQNHDPSLP